DLHPAEAPALSLPEQVRPSRPAPLVDGVDALRYPVCRRALFFRGPTSRIPAGIPLFPSKTSTNTHSKLLRRRRQRAGWEAGGGGPAGRSLECVSCSVTPLHAWSRPASTPRIGTASRVKGSEGPIFGAPR